MLEIEAQDNNDILKNCNINAVESDKVFNRRKISKKKG